MGQKRVINGSEWRSVFDLQQKPLMCPIPKEMASKDEYLSNTLVSLVNRSVNDCFKG